MKKIFVDFLFVLLMTCTSKSCCTHEELDSNLYLETIPKEMLMDSDTLTGDLLVDGDEFVHAARFYVYADSVLIIQNEPKGDAKHFFEFRNLSTKQFIATRFNNGRGPGEILSAQIQIDGKFLYVDDFVRRVAVKCEIPNLLNHPSRQEDFVEYRINSSDFTFISDDELLILNPYFFKNSSMRIDNKETRFLRYPQDVSSFGKKGKKVCSFDVNQGPVLYNKNHNRVVYASLDLPFIELYDLNLNLMKVVNIECDIRDVRYKINNDTNSIYFDLSNGVPRAFNFIYHTDDSIYFVFHGDWFRHNEFNLDTHILRFDWEGNFIESYYFDKYIYSISLTSEADAFYAGCYEKSTGESLLYRLTINKTK